MSVHLVLIIIVSVRILIFFLRVFINFIIISFISYYYTMRIIFVFVLQRKNFFCHFLEGIVCFSLKPNGKKYYTQKPIKLIKSATYNIFQTYNLFAFFNFFLLLHTFSFNKYFILLKRIFVKIITKTYFSDIFYGCEPKIAQYTNFQNFFQNKQALFFYFK